MSPVSIPVIGVILGCFIPIIAIICDYLTKKSKMQVIAKAIEKGLPLDGLSLEDEKGPRVPYRSGMIVLAVGIGMCICAFFIGKIADKFLYLVLGFAAIPTLVGTALVINDKINDNRSFNKESDIQSL